MYNENFINFKRKRDLGAILSDTFKFIRIEWKPFFATIFKLSFVPVLIAICAVIYYAMISVSFLSELSLTTDDDVLDFNFSKISLPLLVFLISYLVAYASITVSALSYIKSYIVNNGVVNYDDIQKSTKEKLLSYVGLLLLVGIIIFFGMLFCFLPGIYFAVVLSLSVCLLIFEDKTVFESINDSFSFIKNHWWETFGILLVVQLIIIVASIFINLPASLYQAIDIKSILENQNTEEILSAFSDPVYLIVLAFSYFVKFVLYLISIISVVFIYYDIKEQKNPSSDVINRIGIE